MKNKYILLLALSISSLIFGHELQELQENKEDSSEISSEQKSVKPSLLPFPQNASCHIGIGLDFLYWGIQLDGFDYAISSANNQSVTEGFGTSYNPGFKVGLQAVFPQNLWIVDFEYTYIHQNDTQTNGFGYSPLYNVGNLLGSRLREVTANSINAEFIQTFNNLDITLGKYLQFSKWTLFKPYIGIQGAYIDYKYLVNYYDCFGPSLDDPTNLFVNMRNYYWAAGIKLGFDSIWHITKSFSIVGDLGLSGLSANFNIKRKDYFSTTTNPEDKIQNVDVNSKIDSGTFVLDVLLGLRYELWSKDQNLHFSLTAGWEAQNWYNLSQQIYLNETQSSSGSLSMQGLTLKASLNF